MARNPHPLSGAKKQSDQKKLFSWMRRNHQLPLGKALYLWLFAKQYMKATTNLYHPMKKSLKTAKLQRESYLKTKTKSIQLFCPIMDLIGSVGNRKEKGLNSIKIPL